MHVLFYSIKRLQFFEIYLFIITVSTMTDNEDISCISLKHDNDGTKFNAGSEENFEESPISKLNDDCLIHIFEHLQAEDRLVAEKGMLIFEQ